MRVGAEALPQECLPIGMTAEDMSMKVCGMLLCEYYRICTTSQVVPVDMTPEALNNHLLAVSQAKAQDRAIDTNVAGFVAVTAVNSEAFFVEVYRLQVDTNRKMLTLLSPQPAPLASNLLLYSDVVWFDDK